MEFRPCIDIHNGQVKQIVGGSLRDKNDMADTNFVSEKDSAYYAKLYKDYNLKGGHVILLNGKDSPYYEATKAEAKKALIVYKNGLQVGGGITADNAYEYIEAGASHVIVTSYVFKEGKICYNSLERLVQAVGSEHLVLDVSVRKKDDEYYVVTDRWQKFTDTVLSEKLLTDLSSYCDEFLIHAVDVEGKSAGIDENVIRILAGCSKNKVTYAGGISSLDDIKKIKILGCGNVNITIGSALNLFGGRLMMEDVIECIR